MAVMEAWKSRLYRWPGLRSGSSRRNAQLEFYPEHLAIQETPPSPAGRWLCITLTGLALFAIIWSMTASLDIVVAAQGRVVPAGQVKVIQPLGAGKIQRIHVVEGQRVQKGEVLLELESTVALAEREARMAQQNFYQSELEWRGRFAQWLESPAPGCAPPVQRASLSVLFYRHCIEMGSKLLVMQREQMRSGHDLAEAQAEKKRAESGLAVLRQRVAAYRTLHEKQFGSRVAYLEMLQQETELSASLPVLAARISALEEAVQAYGPRKESLLNSAQRENDQRVHELRQQLQLLANELEKHHYTVEQKIVRAPVDGVVEELAVHTIGGVVSPAQALMKIVPSGARALVEISVPNRDRGFLREGQKAMVKLDAFDFTRYGGIEAIVEDIGEDAVADEHLGWVFPARLRLTQDGLEVAGEWARAQTGMTARAEIKTGQRRIVDYFLSPLVEVAQGSLKER